MVKTMRNRTKDLVEFIGNNFNVCSYFQLLRLLEKIQYFCCYENLDLSANLSLHHQASDITALDLYQNSIETSILNLYGITN